MNDKLAVLVPVCNGGRLLRETVASCARCGLLPESYEIVVVDDCSSDGAAECLPACDPNGAMIWVYRNAAPLGRIGNLNRCVALAEADGFAYFTFLLVGEILSPESGLPQLLERARRSDAALVAGNPAFKRVPQEDETLTQTRDLMCLNFHLVNSPLTSLRSKIYRQMPGKNPIFNRSVELGVIEQSSSPSFAVNREA